MPTSKAQVRLAYAVLEGKSDAMPKGVAKEMIAKWEGMNKKERKHLKEKAAPRK